MVVSRGSCFVSAGGRLGEWYRRSAGNGFQSQKLEHTGNASRYLYTMCTLQTGVYCDYSFCSAHTFLYLLLCITKPTLHPFRFLHGSPESFGGTHQVANPSYVPLCCDLTPYCCELSICTSILTHPLIPQSGQLALSFINL